MTNKTVFIDTKKRLIKITIAVVGSLLLLFSLFIYSYFKNVSYKEIDNKLKDELEYVTMQFDSSFYSRRIVLNDYRDSVYIYKDDKRIYYIGNSYFESLNPNEKNGKENKIFTYSEGGFTFRELNVSVNSYKIHVVRTIDSELSSLRQLLFVLIIGVILCMIITYYIAIYLTKKALIPIEEAWINQEKFIQDASHELRTPIAIISSKLESLLKHPSNTIGNEVENIADAMKESRRLKKMISDLLVLSKEDAIVSLNLEQVNIEELINEISSDYSDIAYIQEKKLNISSKINKKIISTDKLKLRQLILIFIDNAFKYTKTGDSIFIKLRQEKEGSINIYIKDTGIGIRKEDIPFVFDRFFRSESVRSKDIDGSGIGLSIAKKMEKILKVEISVVSDLGEGSEFKIQINNI